MHQAKKSPSNAVGARVVRSGWVGLHGRPRPVALAASLEEYARLPSAGNHQGPPNPTSTTLAPTAHPVLFPTIDTSRFTPHRVLLKHHRGPLQKASRTL